MPATEKNLISLAKLGTLVKTWLPIVITIGGLVVGYFLFKSETKHQFDIQQRETAALEEKIVSIQNSINENRRDWQRAVDGQLQKINENNIRINYRLKALEYIEGVYDDSEDD